LTEEDKAGKGSKRGKEAEKEAIIR